MIGHRRWLVAIAGCVSVGCGSNGGEVSDAALDAVADGPLVDHGGGRLHDTGTDRPVDGGHEPDAVAEAGDAGSDVTADAFTETGSGDTGAEVGPIDAGTLDSGSVDAGAPDTGVVDTGAIDTGSADAGSMDTGPVDTGPVDSGSIDTGAGDTGAVDGGTDAGPEGGTVTTVAVLQHHLNDNRDGHYIDPKMTPAAAATLVVDPTFDGTISGPLWGQPLYVADGVAGKGTFYVADDNNDVYAIDEATGTSVWSKTPLALPAGMAGSGCGNVTPVGVTGTPVIDLATRTMYLSAAVGTGSGISTHEIHALSIDDGSEVSGWPIDVSTLTSAGGIGFNPPPQGQRSALSLVNGYLYVPFGGEYGDCGTYYGWVVSVPVATPASASGFTTAAQGGGIWAAGGMSSDGVDMFATTGNATIDTTSLSWAMAGSEAVLRFHDGSSFDFTNTANYFTPSNWQSLDAYDIDLSGTGPIVVDVPGATPSALVLAFGKTGVLHILDRSNLGGVGTGDGTTGEGLFSDQVAGGEIKTSPATYTTPAGTFVVFHADGNGTSCPGTPGDLIAVQITPTSPPTFTTVWCADTGGAGAPIVTTTDAAGSNPIVWVVGAEGSNALMGWDGATGANVFDGSLLPMDTVLHFSTLIEVNGRIIVGSNDRLYAFKPM